MNLKKCFGIILILFFYNCDVQFDGNTRVETIGNIKDENNIPLENVFIGIYTENARFPGFYPTGSGTQYLLGNGYSDSDGNFSVTSIFDSDQDFFIFIDGNNNFTDYIYSANTTQFRPDDFIFNLNEVIIKSKANVSFNITRNSPPGTTLDFNINYQDPRCEEVYINGILDEESSNCFRVESIFRTLDDENPEFMTSFVSFATATIQFNYRINGGNQITETFIINQNNYEINFSY